LGSPEDRREHGFLENTGVLAERRLIVIPLLSHCSWAATLSILLSAQLLRKPALQISLIIFFSLYFCTANGVGMPIALPVPVENITSKLPCFRAEHNPMPAFSRVDCIIALLFS
jgi:hypothetical protein